MSLVVSKLKEEDTLSSEYPPSLSSSQFSWRCCAAAAGPHGVEGSHWDLQTCWTASPPASQRLSVCSRRWCSLCGTCGTFSSPAGERADAWWESSFSQRYRLKTILMAVDSWGLRHELFTWRINDKQAHCAVTRVFPETEIEKSLQSVFLIGRRPSTNTLPLIKPLKILTWGRINSGIQYYY